MTENAVHFLAKNELGHFSTARFWPGPSLDWRSPHWHLMGFLCYSSLPRMTFKPVLICQGVTYKIQLSIRTDFPYQATIFTYLLHKFLMLD